MSSLHPSHRTRVSMDSSRYDEICYLCGATDITCGGWGELAKPCPASDEKRAAHDAEHRKILTERLEVQE